MSMFYSQEPTNNHAAQAIYQIYRDSHSGVLGWDAAVTPRKWRTIYASNNFQPTWLYRKQSYTPESEWIGKYFIPIDSKPQYPDNGNYITEYDVQRKSGMYSYRVLYAVKNNKENGYYPKSGDPKWVIKSKPSVEGRPGQMNIILSTDNRVLSVENW